jgi:ribokinase
MVNEIYIVFGEELLPAKPDVDPVDFVQSGLGSEGDMMKALRNTDVLKPCKPAARALTGENDPEKMARKLLSFGPKAVAMTMGAEGSLIASGESITYQPAYRVKVVDTTGAGDAYMGGLSFALLMEWPLDRVASFANACAALCCTRVGARATSAGREVEALVDDAAG